MWIGRGGGTDHIGRPCRHLPVFKVSKCNVSHIANVLLLHTVSNIAFKINLKPFSIHARSQYRQFNRYLLTTAVSRIVRKQNWVYVFKACLFRRKSKRLK